MHKITTLFLDVGGVLLTNGWDHLLREETANHFGFDFAEFEERHKKIYHLHETDRISLDEYLNQTIFWKERNFSLHELKDFIYGHTRAYTEMLSFISSLKETYPVKIAIVSNEGRELTEFRIRKFKLDAFADFFFVSCFVHYQKPDSNIYKIALDVAHVSPEEVLYIDDRPQLVEAGIKLGIQGIVHQEYQSTKEQILTILGGNLG